MSKLESLLAEAGIESGESGAAGLAGLLALCSAPELTEPRRRFGIDASTNVLIFSTEGATDPGAYTAVVEHPARVSSQREHLG